MEYGGAAEGAEHDSLDLYRKVQWVYYLCLASLACDAYRICTDFVRHFR